MVVRQTQGLVDKHSYPVPIKTLFILDIDFISFICMLLICLDQIIDSIEHISEDLKRIGNVRMSSRKNN